MTGLALDERDVDQLAALLDLVPAADTHAPWPFLHRLQNVIGCEMMVLDEAHAADGPVLLTRAAPEGRSDPPDGRWLTQLELVTADPRWSCHWGRSPEREEARLGRRTLTTVLEPLPDGSGQAVRLRCFRATGAGFGERERFLLALLGPYVSAAYRSAVRRLNRGALTPRQLEIMDLVREGLTNRQIAHELDMAEATVRTHLSHIFERLAVTSRTAAVTKVREGHLP